MFWHTRIFKEGLVAKRSSTTKFDLPANTNIGSIFLMMQCKMNTGTPMGALAKWRLIDYIDSIDIVANGSTVIKSLPATALSALCLFDHVGFPSDMEREYSQPTVRVNSFINFGRYYRDPEYYIPAGRFGSLELQIKFSGSSTLYQQEMDLKIVIEQPEGGGVPPSKGFMTTEVWREYTTVSDAYEYLTLPTKYKIRRLILQVWADLDDDEIERTNIFQVVNEVKLTTRSGALELYNGTPEYQAKINSALLGGPFQRFGQIQHDVDKGWYTGLGYVFSCMVTGASGDGAESAVNTTVKQDNQNGTQVMETYDGNEMVPFQVIGVCPDNCILWRFDDDPDPSTWLDPQAEKDVDLELHTRSGTDYDDGTVKVILDRLVPA